MFSNRSLSFRFSNWNFILISCLSCQATCPAHFTIVNLIILNICWKVQIILILQFSPDCVYFASITSRHVCCPQHTVQKHPQSVKFSHIEVDRRFRDASETSVNFNMTTRRNISEDSKLHTRRLENLKSHPPVKNNTFLPRYLKLGITQGRYSCLKFMFTTTTHRNASNMRLPWQCFEVTHP
jgi:hypothetical protein